MPTATELDSLEMTGEATSKQLVKAADEWLHPLVPYGASKALREMTRRIMALDRGEIKMNPYEAAHLAQIAASSVLNPFTGEVWAWISINKRGERVFTVMPGRKGLLRHAHEQARDRGTHFWPEYHQVTDPDRRKTLSIPSGAMAFECRLKDHLAITTWQTSVRVCKDAGYSPEEIRREAGPMPFTYGLGILTAQEMANLDKSGRNKMTHVDRCQKRAYMMALKQAYDLPLGGNIGSSGETIDDYVLEGEWRDVDTDAEEIPDALKDAPREVLNRWFELQQQGMELQAFLDTLTPDERKAMAKDANETLYGKAPAEDPKPIDPEKKPKKQLPGTARKVERTWDSGLIVALRKSNHFPNNAHSKRIVATLKKSPFNDADPYPWIDEWLTTYKQQRGAGKEPDDAAIVATTVFAQAHIDDDDAIARFEAEVLAAWVKGV